MTRTLRMGRLLIGMASVLIFLAPQQPVKATDGDGVIQRVVERGPVADQGTFRRVVASEDGQVVAFYTARPMTIVGLPPLPFTPQVVIRDLRNNTVELASRTPTGDFQNNPLLERDTGPLSISDDGRFVAFSSSATNLDPAASVPGFYTYLYDRQTRQVRVLDADAGVRPTRRGWGMGVIDGAATKVVFLCRGLVGLPPAGDEFAICERSLASFDARVVRGGLLQSDSSPFESSTELVLSRDGRTVFYASVGPLLTTGAPNPGGRISQLYAIDVSTGGVELISRSADGSPANLGGGGIGRFGVSRDGDFVAFESSSTNLVPGLGGLGGIVMIQRSTGIARLVSPPNGMGTIQPSVSSDGRRVAYLDYSGHFDRRLLRVYDWETQSRRWLEQTLSGLPNRPICGTDLIFGGTPTDSWQLIGLSGDGRSVFFPSLASNLVPGDVPDTCDLFVRQLGPVPQPAMPVPSLGPRWSLLAALLLALVGLLALRGGLSPR